MTQFSKTILASLFTFSAAGASAAAFQLAEVSTSGLGMAYAGNAAVADNASVVANNPALMTKFTRPMLSAGSVLVDTDIIINGTTASGNSAYASNAVPTSPLPNLYFVAPVTDKFALGAGYNVNYGLETDYSNTYNAGSLGGTTSLAAHNFNLSGAYNFGNGLSFGAGINAIYSKAKFERTLGDAGQYAASQLRAGAAQAAAAAAQLTAAAAQLSAAGATAKAAELSAQAATASAKAAQYQALAAGASAQDKTLVMARLTGDEWSYGWNAGLTYELNENHRWGLAYHSAVNVKFKGKYTNNVSATNPLALIGAVDYPLAGENAAGRLTLHLPAYWELSGFHKLSDKFAVQYSYKRTEWSRFKTLDAYGANGENYLHKDEYFKDSDRYALGVSYDASEALTLRAGVAYDETASKSHQSISIPDTNRMWYSVGATYRVTPNLSVDAGYAFLRGTKTSFEEDGAKFESKARAHLYGLNLNYSF